jgi:hypothetical protein
MKQTPPVEETPKDYATRPIDLEQPQNASETPAPEAEKKSRTRKTSVRSVEAADVKPSVTIPVDDRPVFPPLPPPPLAPTPALPAQMPRNEGIWIAAIFCICFVVLACICSCTVVATAFLNNAPW